MTPQKGKPPEGGHPGLSGPEQTEVYREMMMSTTEDTIELEHSPSAHEAEALAAHNARKSSRDKVYDAILELSDGETPAKAPDIASVTGLSTAIVYDCIKTLKQRGRVFSDNGAFYPCQEYQDTQSVSHTILPGGSVKLEKGDQVMDLNPREARALFGTGAAVIQQAAVIVMDRRLDEQQAQIRRLQRDNQRLAERINKLEPSAQLDLLGG